MPQQKTQNQIPVNTRKIRTLPDLQEGDSHQDIQEVQNYLKRFGYMREDVSVAADVFEDPTVRALSRFQQRYGVGEPGILDEATRKLMAAERCGLPDVQDPLAFSTRCPWNRRNITFAFGPLTSQVTNNQARTAVRNAFNTWAAAGVGLSFTEVGLANNPDIRIEWRQAADPDNSMVGNVIAHADFPPGCSIIVNTLPLPLHYDDQEHQWVIGLAANGLDIETVTLHEIGHLLGLQHTNVSGSVMFPMVSTNFTLRGLQPDDLAGIRSLYPNFIRSLTTELNSDGRLEVFGVGRDSSELVNIWQTAPSAGPWSGWNRIG